jgi:hypothetical protein
MNEIMNWIRQNKELLNLVLFIYFVVASILYEMGIF